MKTNLKISTIIVLSFLIGCEGIKKKESKNFYSSSSSGKTQKLKLKPRKYERKGQDPYKLDLYWSLNKSPMQKKLRDIKPFPVGVVYYQQLNTNLDSIEHEFKTISDYGFTALKQIQIFDTLREKHKKDVFHKALDNGITPWYYGKGGWAPIDQQLVDSLGIDMKVNDKNMPAIQKHPKMKSYQDSILRNRIAKMHKKPERPEGMGEPGRNGVYLPERLIPHFAEWLKEKYGTIEKLNEAWHCHYSSGPDPFKSFKNAANLMKVTHKDEYGRKAGKQIWDFRPARDAMKFGSTLITDNYKKTMKMFNEWDPYEPERTGGHQVFENQAINAWDLEAQAQAAAIGGSFYSSIHLAHHFFLVDGEFTRPVYMQARTVADMFKGGWAATWESTGGPTQWSGMNAATVDGDVMKQLMYSYIAAGLKGIGFWTWNSRAAGWEAGEYALTNLQGEPGGRAKVAGNISQILQDQRFELWESVDKPTVGILYSWENEAILGRLSFGTYPLPLPFYETNRDAKFQQRHSEAKIGASRAFINNNISYEYVTERDLEAGLADRYEVIYMPFMLALADKHRTILEDYVKNGGRLIADAPVWMYDSYGELTKYRKGKAFESIFGAQIQDFYNTQNETKIVNGKKVKGQYMDLTLTSASIMETFQDGKPAIIENKYGKGSALLLNFEAGRMAFEPGNTKVENMIVKNTLGDKIKPHFVTNGHSMVYRRVAPKADHYFIINDGQKEKLKIKVGNKQYKKAINLYRGKAVSLSNNGKTISLNVPQDSGIWLRCIKK